MYNYFCYIGLTGIYQLLLKVSTLAIILESIDNDCPDFSPVLKIVADNLAISMDIQSLTIDFFTSPFDMALLIKSLFDNSSNKLELRYLKGKL